MKTKNLPVLLLLLAGAWPCLQLAASLEPQVAEAIEFINERLTHSNILSIADNGLVKIKAPHQVIQFNIKEVSFNYNGLNDDDRVRVLGDYCLKIFADDRLAETTLRESFLCKTKTAASEVIAALQRLKKTYLQKDGRFARFDKKFSSPDQALKYGSVLEAIDFINENLAISAVLQVAANGIMLINGPDNMYKVNLGGAEFGYNGLGDDPRVRIYGEWCLETYDAEGRGEEMTREAFTANSRGGADQVIKALYYLKSACTDLSTTKIADLRNVSGSRRDQYATVAEAIDYINDRLAISIILGIDDQGMVTVNSPESIYKFDVSKSAFSRTHEKSTFWDFTHIVSRGKENEAVAVNCPHGLAQFQDGQFHTLLDEENFQCQSFFAVDEVVKALDWIANKIKVGKGQ